MDEEKVAHIIEDVHLDTSVLTYNNENALSYVLSIAYIAARNEYTMVSENCQRAKDSLTLLLFPEVINLPCWWS